MKRYDDLILNEDGTIEKVTQVTIPSGEVKTREISLIEAAKHFRDKPNITIHSEIKENDENQID